LEAQPAGGRAPSFTLPIKAEHTPRQPSPDAPVYPQDEGGRALHAALERAGVRVQLDGVAGADYYTLLGLAVDHGPEELKKAYKRMSKVGERRSRGNE
jgi:hypothetical protein